MTIEQRVAKLERQNRWLKRVGGLVLATFACVVLMGQGKPKELPDLVAKSLTLKDENGKTRAELRMVALGKWSVPTLVFRGARGDRQAALVGGPAPQLILETVKTAVGHAIGLDGNPSLSWMRRRQGHDSELFSLAMMNDNVPVMFAWDTKGKLIWQVPSLK